MKSLPVKAKTKRSQVRTVDAQLERIEPVGSFNPFFSFTYSRQEMYTSSDGRTQIKSKKVLLENGRIESEEFEGQLPAAIFEKSLQDSQRLFADQAIRLLKQFSFFPLLPRTGPGDDDFK